MADSPHLAESQLRALGGISLADALDAYLRRFRKAEPDLYHVLRSLTFFDDAERDAIMPAGMSSELWLRIREHFEEVVPSELARRINAPSP